MEEPTEEAMVAILEVSLTPRLVWLNPSIARQLLRLTLAVLTAFHQASGRYVPCLNDPAL
jgi:hypothetical protein